MTTYSYSTDLYNSFDLVDQAEEQKQSELNSFVQSLKDYSNLEDYYSKGLEKIALQVPEQFNKGSLSYALCSFKNFLLNKAMQHKSLHEHISKNLYEPLKDLAKDQSISIKMTSTEGRIFSKTKKALFTKHQKAKDQYFSACQECENLTICLDTQDVKTNRHKMMQKLLNSKKELDMNLKRYKSTVGEYNQFIEKYDSVMPRTLEVYQEFDKQRLEVVKNSLQKLTHNEEVAHRNTLYENESLQKVIDSVNLEEDFNSFVAKNYNPREENTKLQLQPYEGTHPEYKNLGQRGPRFTLPHPDSSLEKVRESLDYTIERIWQGEQLSSQELKQTAKAFGSPRGRQAFIQTLRQRLMQARTALEPKAFKQLASLILMLLTSLTEEFEVPVAMAVIHFSQSFYNQVDSQCLYEFVAFHTIWNALEHWEEIINSAIQEEIKAHKEHSSSFIHDIAVSNLLQFRKIMKNFKVEESGVKSVIFKIGKVYRVCEEELEIIARKKEVNRKTLAEINSNIQANQQVEEVKAVSQDDQKGIEVKEVHS